jgi:hypothetical protein
MMQLQPVACAHCEQAPVNFEQFTVPPTQPGTALQPAVCVHTDCVLSAHAFGEPTHLAAGLTNWQPGMTS